MCMPGHIAGQKAMISLITWTGRAVTSFRQAVHQQRRSGSRAYPVRAHNAPEVVKEASRSVFELSRVPLTLR